MFAYFLRLRLTNGVFLAISDTVRDILECEEYFHVIWSTHHTLFYSKEKEPRGILRDLTIHHFK